MNHKKMATYIAGLPVGTIPWGMEDELVEEVPIDALPEGIVTGSNLIQFSNDTSPTVRSATALSLLAAQRVAFNDTVLASPDEWVDRHNTVLRNLNWLIDSGGYVDSEFKDLDVAVHEAIIPFLTAAFGPAAAAATLILKALEQLKTMSEEKDPWIKLWDRESRRFEVSEYQFTYVEQEGADAILRLAAARLDAKFGKTQVLFFKVKKEAVNFLASSSTMRGNTELLAAMEGPLKAKLAAQVPIYISTLPIGE